MTNNSLERAIRALENWETKLLELDLSKYDDPKKLIQDLQDEIRLAESYWHDYTVERKSAEGKSVEGELDNELAKLMNRVLQYPRLFGKGTTSHGVRDIFQMYIKYRASENSESTGSKTDTGEMKTAGSNTTTTNTTIDNKEGTKEGVSEGGTKDAQEGTKEGVSEGGTKDAQEGTKEDIKKLEKSLEQSRMKAEIYIDHIKTVMKEIEEFFADTLATGTLQQRNEDELKDLRLKYMERVWTPASKTLGGEYMSEKVREYKNRIIIGHNAFLPNLFRPFLTEMDTASLIKQFDALKTAFKDYFNMRVKTIKDLCEGTAAQLSSVNASPLQSTSSENEKEKVSAKIQAIKDNLRVISDIPHVHCL